MSSEVRVVVISKTAEVSKGNLVGFARAHKVYTPDRELPVVAVDGDPCASIAAWFVREFQVVAGPSKPTFVLRGTPNTYVYLLQGTRGRSSAWHTANTAWGWNKPFSDDISAVIEQLRR